jgi:hypothetical protein
MRRKVYTRTATASGEVMRALLLLAWTLAVVPLKLSWAIISGLLGGVAEGHQSLKPRKKRME